ASPLRGDWRPDGGHAHYGLVAHAAITLRELTGAPLVATIHATEAGRHGGWLSAPLNRQVHSAEWWLANAADGLVTCSRAMRDEGAGLFDVDTERVTALHNGIDASGGSAPAAVTATARSGHRTSEQRHSPVGAPTLVTFGRLEWEKGIQDVVAALPAIRRAHPGTRLLVAGTGSHAAWLAGRARAARVRRAVTMLGHVDDAALVDLLGRASAVV